MLIISSKSDQYKGVQIVKSKLRMNIYDGLLLIGQYVLHKKNQKKFFDTIYI